MQPTTTIPPDEAAKTLASVQAARHTTRGRLRSYWYPLIVFGTLTMLSAPFFELWDGGGVALFWLVAAPAGTFAVVRHQRRHALATGACRGGRPYDITAAALIAACFGLGIIGGVTDHADVANFGPPLAISAAYLAFAWLERSIALAVLATALAVLSINLAVADIDHAPQIVALSYGASFAIVGLVARARSPRS